MGKGAVREMVWNQLEENGIARFPFPPHGRIPNFAGAEDAANTLKDTALWNDADFVKANPDSPQRPIRYRALESGKTVYLAVPRLSDERCFIELDPDDIDDIREASTLTGSGEHGSRIYPDTIDRIDLVIVGSVAVTKSGDRIGKGEGYSDLEYAILRELGHADDETPVVTTVHGSQIVEKDFENELHDVPLDRIITTTDSYRVDLLRNKPAGIYWDLLDEEKYREIPILRKLHSNNH